MKIECGWIIFDPDANKPVNLSGNCGNPKVYSQKAPATRAINDAKKDAAWRISRYSHKPELVITYTDELSWLNQLEIRSVFVEAN